MVVNEEKNLKYSLIGWNGAYGKLDRNEEITLRFYKISYEDEIPKAELKTALTSLESWSQYAYKNRLLFHVTAFLENDQPYADILLNDGNVIVKFIDEYNRIYLKYGFTGKFDKKKLFLNSLHYFIYPEHVKEFTNDDIRDIQYIFTPEGKLTIWDRYLEDGKWYEEAKEAAEPVNVASNWQAYPKLGEYGDIVRMKRWEEGELALPFRGAYPTSYVDTYDGRSLTKTNTPYHKLNEEEQQKYSDALVLAEEKHTNGNTAKAIEILENAYRELPEPKENFRAASDITLKIADYQAETKNFEAAFAELDKLEQYLNADDYDVIALYRAKMHHLAGENKKAFDLFQAFKLRRTMQELRTKYAEYNAIFQKLL